jgi:hypothetical protein
MTATADYDELHHFVDRLPPQAARRLRALVETDPELAAFTAAESEQTAKSPQRLSFIGIWDSGRGDLSERHDDIIRERLKRSS